ncbi:MAG: glycosyltransferase family 4 protein [Desulfobacterales bacterium]
MKNQEEREESRGAIHILHLLSSGKFTGAAEPVLRLARAQHEAGHAVKLAVRRKKPDYLARKAAEYALSVDDDLSLSVKAWPRLQIKNLIRLYHIWRYGHFDIIHSHLTNDHTLAALARPKNTRTRLVRTLHTERAQGRFRNWQLKRADGLIVVAEKYRKRLIEAGYLDSDRILTIRGSVDCSRFHPGTGGDGIRRELGIDLDAPVAGIVSRLKEGRGHEWLLEAWKAVHEQAPRAVLVIAGRGPSYRHLHALARQGPWSESVRFLGFRQDLPDVYRAFDVKIILAPGNDGTCRAALEAMASGVPVLSSNVGALGEIVDDGKAGAVVPNHDVDALSEALVRLLSQPVKLAEMGKSARLEAEREFTIERQGERVEDFYRRVLGDWPQTLTDE